MPQAATNPKIDELRAKLKADPKSRLFYQLAEELRKSGHAAESEDVLRSGLSAHPTYLAAWVSLGRTLRELRKDADAIEPLNKALQLDPGNVVAARLLGDAYHAMGDRLEAVKKYKLVHALLPGDDELNARIAELERELTPMAVSAADPEPDQVASQPSAAAPPFDPAPASDAHFASAAESLYEPAAEPSAGPSADAGASVFEDSPFDQTLPPFDEGVRGYVEEQTRDGETADDEPMSLAHSESPFEEPMDAFTSSSMTIESPAGFQISSAPLSAEVAAPFDDEMPVADSLPVFDTPAGAAPAAPEDATSTLTMADLYVRQGLVEEARHIYENILARDPGNDDVRARLEAIAPRVNPKISRLERWLSRITREAGGGV
jgi:tetratricopeptide (TPR) repeat protein